MGERRAVRRSVVAVARNPRLLRLAGAYTLFTNYEMALWVAVLLWAYQVGGAAFAGTVAVLQYVPAALLAPVGGRIGDRARRDVALRGGYLAQGASIGLLAVLLGVGAETSAVVAAAIATCVLIAWTRPPHYAAAAELSRTPADLAAANSLSGTLERAGYCLGPVLAGLSASLGGPAVTVGVCAGMAVASALLLVGVRLGEPAGSNVEGAATLSAVASLTSQVVRRPAVAAVLVVVGVEFLAEGCLELLAIAFASDHMARGAAAAGLLIGAVGFGGILGAGAGIVLIRWRRLWGAVSGSLAASAVPLLTFPLISRLLPAVAVLILVGAGMGFFAVAGITVLQRAVDDALMARVLALRESAMLTGMALGAALTPLLVRAFGPAGGYAVLGVTLVVLSVATVPALRRLDETAVHRPHLVGLLQGIGFLAVLDVQALERLAHSAVEMTLDAGSDVVREGEAGELFYVVEEGDLLVTVSGRTETVRLGPGSGFGEIALLRRVPRTATVRTTTPCRLWRIHRDLFLATLAGSSGQDIAERHIDAQLRRMSARNWR